MKWVLLLAVAVIGYMVYTGNMGGARDATRNYVEVRHSKTDNKAMQERPNILQTLMRSNPFKSND
jgi:flagellar basal body-associated protein FliL